MKDLRALFLEDIGAVLIPRPASDLNKAQRAEIRELARVFSGLALEHIEALARRANETNAPGVTVVALGRGKAGCLRQMIHYGLVNELIIDPEQRMLLHHYKVG